eukprot:UN24927
MTNQFRRKQNIRNLNISVLSTRRGAGRRGGHPQKRIRLEKVVQNPLWMNREGKAIDVLDINYSIMRQHYEQSKRVCEPKRVYAEASQKEHRRELSVVKEHRRELSHGGSCESGVKEHRRELSNGGSCESGSPSIASTDLIEPETGMLDVNFQNMIKHNKRQDKVNNRIRRQFYDETNQKNKKKGWDLNRKQIQEVVAIMKESKRT